MKLDFWKNLDVRMKRLIYLAIGFVALIIIFFVVFKIFAGNKASYQQMENTLRNAAISYYENNKELLPKENGNEITIDATQLVSEGYLKSFEKYNKEVGPNCNGQVYVVNNNGHYLYSPNLNCTDYKSVTLTNQILNDHEIVTEGNGLYQANDEYVYRGEYINNYVTFAGQTWRILKIDAEGYIKLVQEGRGDNAPFDDRYNAVEDNYYGINNFEVSRVKEELSILYNDNEIFKDTDREKIASKNLCIGKRSGTEKINDGSLECRELTTDKYPLGLLQLNEAINPSIDDNCTTPFSESCANYNYLANIVGNSWTLTANSENTYEVFSVFAPYLRRCSTNERVNIVLYLSNRLLYTSGKGTSDNPYVIE